MIHLIPLYFVMGLMKHYQDPPHGSEYWIPTDPDFAQAIDLVRYIKTHPEFASHFCIGVAGECSGLFCHFHVNPYNLYLSGYPDGHDDSFTLDEEVQHLKAKIVAGAEFIVTQVFYDIDQYIHWQHKVKEAGNSIFTSTWKYQFRLA